MNLGMHTLHTLLSCLGDAQEIRRENGKGRKRSGE